MEAVYDYRKISYKILIKTFINSIALENDKCQKKIFPESFLMKESI
jgi:hypothetical protein